MVNRTFDSQENYIKEATSERAPEKRVWLTVPVKSRAFSNLSSQKPRRVTATKWHGFVSLSYLLKTRHWLSHWSSRKRFIVKRARRPFRFFQTVKNGLISQRFRKSPCSSDLQPLRIFPTVFSHVNETFRFVKEIILRIILELFSGGFALKPGDPIVFFFYEIFYFVKTSHHSACSVFATHFFLLHGCSRFQCSPTD